jgi:hypothetical protein
MAHDPLAFSFKFMARLLGIASGVLFVTMGTIAAQSKVEVAKNGEQFQLMVNGNHFLLMESEAPTSCRHFTIWAVILSAPGASKAFPNQSMASLCLIARRNWD